MEFTKLYYHIGNIKKKITKNDEKILSDSCEAIIGAIYIDRGFEIAKKLYNYVFGKVHIDKSDCNNPRSQKLNYKNILLKNIKNLPHYRVDKFHWTKDITPHIKSIVIDNLEVKGIYVGI